MVRTATSTAFVLPLLAVALAGLVPSGAGGEPARRRIAVIVAASSRASQIQAAALREIFLGEAIEGPGSRRWIPFNHPVGSAVRGEFERVVIGMRPDALGRYWVDRRIRGLGSAPRTVSSPAVLVRVVARLPGAIAYVAESDLTSEVKALRVDGVALRESGYRLVMNASP